MTEANREIISSSRFAAAERLTEQIKAGVKRLLDEEMFWRCNSDCYSRDAPHHLPTLHSRQCGLEAFLSSHRISHFLFLPLYLFIYLPFFLIPVHLLGIVQGPLSHCVFSTPTCPFLPTPLLPPVAAAFLLRLRKRTSHEPFNRGESRRAPLNWHF